MTELHTRIQKGRRAVSRWDRVFTALAAEPRRQIVASLMDAPPGRSVPLPESAITPNVPVDHRTLQRELYHRHLPLLADQGFIEWEREPLSASRGPRFAEVAVVFDALYETVADIPDALVIGCERLERERQTSGSL